jgi:F-type H+-transporting ATPase subunit delta
MKSLDELINQSSDFKEMILSPTISREDKRNVIFAIADKNNFSKILKKFLGYITIKNRLFFLKKIIENFLNLVSKKKGELKAKLISPKKLSVEEQKKIQSELSKDFKSQLNINYEYDPDLIAGLIIQIGSVMIDTSIKTKLKKLERNMIEA